MEMKYVQPVLKIQHCSATQILREMEIWQFLKL